LARVDVWHDPHFAAGENRVIDKSLNLGQGIVLDTAGVDHSRSILALKFLHIILAFFIL
jgi:hypothetical protein